MFRIDHDKELNCLEVSNESKTVHGKIYLNDGASLRELTLGGQEIIKDLSPLEYSESYASSILFPFVNRVNNGTYRFQDKDYQFQINKKEENNALHGLVYNKTFKVVEPKTNNNALSIKLQYKEVRKSQGFPYNYCIQLEYIFSQEDLILKVCVKNTDKMPFPFTLGWHPYFVSHNLFDSSLEFESENKMVLNDSNITIDVEKADVQNNLRIKNNQLDDCWRLRSGEVIFKTPKYHLNFNATGRNNFLQVYTPPKKNIIAIEPTTGVSDSFNNTIGLQTLNPGKTYNKTWKLQIIKS